MSVSTWNCSRAVFGVELAVELVGDGFVDGGVFAGNDDRSGVHAMFEGIEAGGCLALGGAGTGGFPRVGAIGVELGGGRHRSPFEKKSRMKNPGDAGVWAQRRDGCALKNCTRQASRPAVREQQYHDDWGETDRDFGK